MTRRRSAPFSGHPHPWAEIDDDELKYTVDDRIVKSLD